MIANRLFQVGKKFKILIAITILGTSFPAVAITDSNLTITAVGVQFSESENLGYIYFSSTSGGCAGNLMYIDLSTDAGRGMLALALTARTAGKPIERVDYTGGGGGTCYASLLQM